MIDQTFTPGQVLERSVVRKVATRLAPLLAILYLFCLLDRTNVSIAALTMQKNLRFSDPVYGFGAGIFFLGYFIFEVPSNLIMERVGARRWIARIMVTWGAISASMMFVHTPLSFYSLRFLLGLAEAGFYPGVILYLTYWVPGNARAQVIARFLALTAILGLFGGPLGGLLLKLDGMGGLRGWQWLFLLEGLPSVIIGFAVLWVLPNGPSEASWLSQEEKGWLSKRLAEEARNAQQVMHMSFRVAFSEPRIIHMCAIFIVTSTALNAVGFFGPSLVKARSGNQWSDSFVASVFIIPAVVGAISMSLAAGHSDRTGRRRLHITLGYFVAALGFIGLIFAPNAWLTVAALALNALGERIAAGSYWAVTTNLLGVRAAAGGIALINSVGNLGGFIGPYLMGVLKKSSGGGYAAGLTMAAGLMLVGTVLSYYLRTHPADGGPPMPILEEADGIAAIAQPEQHVP